MAIGGKSYSEGDRVAGGERQCGCCSTSRGEDPAAVGLPPGGIRSDSYRIMMGR